MLLKVAANIVFLEKNKNKHLVFRQDKTIDEHKRALPNNGINQRATDD